ncbi:hypothetical protein EJ08DRAFT_663269 [Tothia fuscella]|uniref:BHLH domain-containing protein n=1 Tax=Tothia fuscella TaxID=1048955 RepID=A0A9P4TWE1_9PEZI|nr:hypothetical protein EJ08DRAFT_663269 [Tothia fuscella]
MDPSSRPNTSYTVSQSLPPITALTNELPLPDPSSGFLRDSGNWSISQSKREQLDRSLKLHVTDDSKPDSSGVSNTGGLQIHTILNAEDSPSRLSIPETPHSARGHPHHALPSLNHGFDHQQHHQRASLDTYSLLDSRRSSVDSRMNAGMNHLAISPSSPYESQNASRVSLVSNLQQQRGIAPDQRVSIASNGTGPISPISQRNSAHRPNTAPRRAPVITPNPRAVSGMPDPTAAAPTKGFPWAFPDQDSIEERRGSSSGSSVDRSEISRQNSYAASMNSSIYTAESSMPPGQKRFDDDPQHIHHHSMQHRSVTSLQATEQGGPSTPGGGNYSRTPELRVSHKMAERKRRSEMKSLFDELNQILPNSPGGKSSKWEILTKAIEHIKGLKFSTDAIRRDNERMRTEIDIGRRFDEENRRLRTEIQTMFQHLQRVDPSNAHVFGNISHHLNHEQQTHQPPAPSSMLPPLQQQQPQWQQAAPPSAMQGVEFPSGAGYEQR